MARGLEAATGREARVVSTEEELAALLAEQDAEQQELEKERADEDEDEDEEGGCPMAGGGSSSDEDASAASSSSSSYAWTDADSLLLQQQSPSTAHSSAPARSALCNRVVPVFPVSNVTGTYAFCMTAHPPTPPQSIPQPQHQHQHQTGQGLDLLRRFARHLPRTRPWGPARRHAMGEFHVDHAFHVSGVGTVLAGAMHLGTVAVGEQMLWGPDRVTGQFRPVVVKYVRACVVSTSFDCLMKETEVTNQLTHPPHYHENQQEHPHGPRPRAERDGGAVRQHRLQAPPDYHRNHQQWQ